MSLKNKGLSRQKVNKNRRRKRRLLYIFIPLLLLVAGVGAWAVNLYLKAEAVISDSYIDDGREMSDKRVEKVHPKFDNVSILIMGIDASDHRENHEAARTDALILATLNKDEKSVKLHSIPRDSYVYIPERGYEDKINHAHYFGGHESTVETVENLFDIPVDYWVKVNFQAFVDVVDALGGVRVEVPYEFQESDSNDKRDSIHLFPGVQTLNGEEALALARTRKKDNDVERGKRQLEIIQAIAHKATSFTSLSKIDDMILAVGDNLETNIKVDEMKGFLHYLTDGKNLTIDSYSLEGYDYQPGSVYYYKLDDDRLEETRQMLKKHLELKDSSLTEGNLELTEEAEETSD